MKSAEYRLPLGTHPELEPIETGRTPDTKGKNGETIPGKPILEYRTIKTPEAENLAEFGENCVEQDKPEEHVLSLAQAQFDIIIQRKIRERASSSDIADMFEGKTPDTKDLDAEGRLAYVLADLQAVADAYRYGSRGPATGGVTKAAKAAFEKDKAVKAAAASNPELAALLAKQEEMLKSMGLTF
jgi:hypothetical protein